MHRSKSVIGHQVSVEDVLFFEVINDSEGSIFTDYSQMTTIRREREGVDSLVGEFPGCYRVDFLVLRVYGFVDQNRMVVTAGEAWRGRLAAVGLLILWHERCIILFLVVDNERAVHMTSEEQILGARDPLDL